MNATEKLTRRRAVCFDTYKRFINWHVTVSDLDPETSRDPAHFFKLPNHQWDIVGGDNTLCTIVAEIAALDFAIKAIAEDAA